MDSCCPKAGRSLWQRKIAIIQISKQNGRMSLSTQMQQKFKIFCTPITAGNVKITDTLYNSCNIFGKQLKPQQSSLGQLEDQALDVTPKISFKPKMAEKYTDVFDQRPNWNPFGAFTAYNWHGSNAQTAHKPTGSTPLGNLNQTLTQNASLIKELISITGANIILIIKIFIGSSLGN